MADTWRIEDGWLVAGPDNRGKFTRLARVVTGGLAFFDKNRHIEVILTASDLDTILRQRGGGAFAFYVGESGSDGA